MGGCSRLLHKVGANGGGQHSNAHISVTKVPAKFIRPPKSVGVIILNYYVLEGNPRPAEEENVAFRGLRGSSTLQFVMLYLHVTCMGSRR